MIRIYKGQWRGIGQKRSHNWLRLEFEFRDVINKFKGPKFHVFMAILLHSDERGRSHPSYDTLERETGYTRPVIAKALKDLCKMEIGGERVLAKWRERDEEGRFVGSNEYLVFPTKDELEEIESPRPQLSSSNFGAGLLKEEPCTTLKEEPLASDDAEKILGDEITQRSKRIREQAKDRKQKTGPELLAASLQQEGVDVGDYPPDLREYARVFIEQFRSPSKGERGLWIKTFREWDERKIAPADIPRALAAHKGEGLAIKGPQSITYRFDNLDAPRPQGAGKWKSM